MQSTPSPALAVVGVVSDVKQFGLDGPATADLYVPLSQMPPSQVPLVAARMYWMVRTRDDPKSLAAAIRDAVSQIDPDVATSSIQTLDDIVRASVAGRRVNVRLLEVFGQLALMLCALGVYAVAAFSARARRGELAIRAAFGATRADLISLMLREELRPVVLGLAVGLCVASIVARELGTLLVATGAMDVLTYFAVGSGLLGVAVVASFLPARRAGLIDPGELLRLC